MTALINSGFNFTFGRTTINLTPADVKKEGPSFDLPIVIGMVAASEQTETDQLENFIELRRGQRPGEREAGDGNCRRRRPQSALIKPTSIETRLRRSSFPAATSAGSHRPSQASTSSAAAHSKAEPRAMPTITATIRRRELAVAFGQVLPVRTVCRNLCRIAGVRQRLGSGVLRIVFQGKPSRFLMTHSAVRRPATRQSER